MKYIKPIPEGYHTVTPYIMVENVEEYSRFLQRAFNGEMRSSTTSANGKILNIEKLTEEEITKRITPKMRNEKL